MSRLVERYRAARRDDGLVVLEGVHALKHALRFGAAVVDVRTPDPEIPLRVARELAPDVAGRIAELVRPVAAEVFDRLAPRSPRTGVVALAERPSVAPTDVVDAPGPLVVLENPRHLGNLGAVVRVAAAVGASGVLTLGAVDPWSPDAVRSSAGLHFAVPVVRAPNLPELPGRSLAALDPDGEQWTGSAPGGSWALAFGTERSGLSAGLLGRADARWRLPMRSGVSSLNLATTVAAALYLLGAAAGPLPFATADAE